MDAFLDPFSEYITKIHNTGITIKCNEATVIAKPSLLGGCLDSVARAPAQCVHQYNGECPCNWCLICGERQPDGSRKFPIPEISPSLRTHENLLMHGREFLQSVEAGVKVNGKLITNVYGVKGVSPLACEPKFDMVKGLIVEVMMHCAWLGSAKQITKAWMEHEKSPYYIGSKVTVTLLDKRIMSLKCPKEARKYPRSLFDLAMWKSRDWENWSLFLSLAALLGILPDRYLKHWALFVEGMHLLHSTLITPADVDLSAQLLAEFLKGVQILYGIGEMT